MMAALLKHASLLEARLIATSRRAIVDTVGTEEEEVLASSPYSPKLRAQHGKQTRSEHIACCYQLCPTMLQGISHDSASSPLVVIGGCKRSRVGLLGLQTSTQARTDGSVRRSPGVHCKG